MIMVRLRYVTPGTNTSFGRYFIIYLLFSYSYLLFNFIICLLFNNYKLQWIFICILNFSNTMSTP